MKREHSHSYWSHSKGIAVVPLIFGVMLLGILGVAVSWEVYNAQVSSVDVAEMHQVYAVAQSGIEFAIRYASDSLAQRRTLYSPGQTRTLPSSGSFPGGRFTVVFSPTTQTLTSTAALIGSSAKRELALMNFMRNYVRPDFVDQFDEPPAQSFDRRYFAVARGWEAATTVLSGIDDPSQPWLEQAFTMAGESNPDFSARGGFFNIGFPWDIFIPGEQEYIMIFPTTPGTGKLTINGLERTGLPVELDEEGYQNYSVEVKFALSPAIPEPDQGFGIIFRLHHPTLPMAGPWNDTDLDYTLFYALQMEPKLGLSPNGGFFVRWWAPDPSLGGRATDEGLCGGEPLYFKEGYCKEQEATPAGLVDVYKGGYFFPENPDYATCEPSAPNNPGWGWNDSNWSSNPWIDCPGDSDANPDMHILRVDVFKNKFTVYFGTEHGIKCDNTDSFVMHKIMEIDVAEERTRRGACVPDYRKGHIGLRAWNGFQAQVDYIKVWRW